MSSFVIYFAETNQSTGDDVILGLANAENRVLITRDKDFGELVFRLKMVHSGIILVRAEELSSLVRSHLVARFIQANLNKISGYFIVIQAGTTRLRKIE